MKARELAPEELTAAIRQFNLDKRRICMEQAALDGWPAAVDFWERTRVDADGVLSITPRKSRDVIR